MAETIVPPTATEPIFKPFKWHHDATEQAHLPGSEVMRFATCAHDISNGARTILEILEQDMLGEEFGDRRLFADSHRSYLMRMAITSLSMLGNDSESIMRWAEVHHTPEGRAAEQSEVAGERAHG